MAPKHSHSEYFEDLKKSVAIRVMGNQVLIRGAWLRFSKKPCFGDMVPIRSEISMGQTPKYLFSCFLPEVNLLTCVVTYYALL